MPILPTVLRQINLVSKANPKTQSQNLADWSLTPPWFQSSTHGGKTPSRPLCCVFHIRLGCHIRLGTLHRILSEWQNPRPHIWNPDHMDKNLQIGTYSSVHGTESTTDMYVHVYEIMYK
jgi:hypothetical protein